MDRTEREDIIWLQQAIAADNNEFYPIEDQDKPKLQLVCLKTPNAGYTFDSMHQLWEIEGKVK